MLLTSRLGVRGLKNALNRAIQESSEFGVWLLGRKALDQRPRKAGHDAVISAEPVVSDLLSVATRQCNYPEHARMPNAIGVEVVLIRQRELEHHELSRRQLIKLFEDLAFEQRFGLGFFRTVDVHLGLNNGHQARVN